MITNCHQCLFAMRKGIERGSINTPSPDLQGLDATSMDNNRDGWNEKKHGKVGMATISCHFFLRNSRFGLPFCDDFLSTYPTMSQTPQGCLPRHGFHPRHRISEYLGSPQEATTPINEALIACLSTNKICPRR